MKTISTLILVLSFTLGYAQVNPIDFEPAGNGANWTWTVFENDTNPALKFVPNPNKTGINTSVTVAKFSALAVGKPWAGCESNKLADIGTFTFSASNVKVKMMVYKPIISDVGLKFATATGEALVEVKVANTKINEWEELTFDVSNLVGLTRSQIIIFPDFKARSVENICYFDNITFSSGAVVTLPEPKVAAPAPIVPAANVISMFSNTYTNVGVDTWRTIWSAGSLTDMQIAGNDVKKYSTLDFVGIETTGANLINASTMDYFHVDAWTPNLTAFTVKLVDFGANGVYGGGDDKEHALTFTPTLEGWNSYDIKMSQFLSLTSKNHIAQLIFVGTPTGSGVVYIDNVYFYTTTVGVTDYNLVKSNIYPNPANNDLTVITNTSNTESNIEIINSIGQTIYTTKIPQGQNSIHINLTDYSAGIYYIKIQNTEMNVVKKLIKE